MTSSNGAAPDDDQEIRPDLGSTWSGSGGLEWKPGSPAPRTLLSAEVPLPGNTLINVSNDAELLAPVLVGDRLEVHEELLEVSPEKETGLGRGHFVTTRSTYANQRGETVGLVTNVLFRFQAGP